MKRSVAHRALAGVLLTSLASATGTAVRAQAALAPPAPVAAARATADAAVLADANADVLAVADTTSTTLDTVTVTAERLGLLGTAASASEGVVADQELQLTPAYRPGQLLETVPGLIVTLHSGEGKANQYLMRGYNLDHGTDLETYVEGMPINQPTHAHGQGYTDLNFVIPELADELTYTKGPYYAGVGDFGAVGSVRMRYRDAIADQVSASAGSFGYERLFTAGTQPLAAGQLLAAAELQHYDGPLVTPDDARKENLVLRYSQGGASRGFSVTGMLYHQLWTNTTDIPIRAIAEDAVPSRFGSLDPSDGGHALRASVSAQAHAGAGDGQLSASGYFIYNQLHLYNDFTHFLIDPVHGDQEDQFENRHVLGATAGYTRPWTLGAIPSELAAGALLRYDSLDVGRLPSQGQVPLSAASAAADPPSFLDSDQVHLFAGALYLQATTHWSEALRSVLGLREDYQRGSDVDNLAALHETAGYSNGGTAAQALLQPKASLIYTPTEHLELYLAAGRGFHSADLRGVNQDKSVNLGLAGTPLLAQQLGEETGLRAQLDARLAMTFALYNLWQRSETIINPDIGQDIAGPPSRRYGAEINLTYQIRRWLELYASYSANHTRYTQAFDDGTGHLGTYITDAPIATGALALYLTQLGPWSGGLQFRYLGNYPLSSGPCMDAAAVHDFPGVASSCTNAPTAPGQVSAKGFGQLNMDLHYAFLGGWSASMGLYNLLNTNAAAAQFWYVDRLKSEIGSYPDGRADVHEHPLEPLMLRVTIAKQF